MKKTTQFELSYEEIVVLKALIQEEHDFIIQRCDGSPVLLEYMRNYLDTVESLISLFKNEQ